MVFAADADSRDYAVAFSIASPDDVPPDFDYPIEDGIRAGVFLPRDDPDWLGRSSYPPRLLLLYPEFVLLLSHPARGRAVERIPLRDIVSVESSRALLAGAIRIGACDRVTEVRYNRRTAGPIESWLAALRDSLLDPPQPCTHCSGTIGGVGLKLLNAHAAELGPRETVSECWFSPSGKRNLRRWLRARRTVEPGNLAIMTGSRIVWISDEVSGAFERYGYTARYAPLREIDSVALLERRDRRLLQVSFQRCGAWHIPVPAVSVESARRFAFAAARILHDRNR
jgi:hypothetical protein